MIQIASLLTEQALADEFVNSLAARRLDEKFFYWFPLSVRAWLALCSDGAYRNFVRSQSLIASGRSSGTLHRSRAPARRARRGGTNRRTSRRGAGPPTN